jgi:hypothetical protein
LGHAVVKLSHEELLVKEKRVHQEVEHKAAGPDAGEGQRPQSRERDETPSIAAASASFNTLRDIFSSGRAIADSSEARRRTYRAGWLAAPHSVAQPRQSFRTAPVLVG